MGPEAGPTVAGSELGLRREVVFGLAGAYSFLREFCWTLRLSPFGFRAFALAMASPLPSPLLDEIHLSVLRLLVMDETKAEREEWRLSLEFLDHLTWSEYLWHYLRDMREGLGKHRHGPAGAERPVGVSGPPAVGEDGSRGVDALVAWAQGRRCLAPRRAATVADYYGQPLDVKLSILNRLLDELLETAVMRAELERRLYFVEKNLPPQAVAPTTIVSPQVAEKPEKRGPGRPRKHPLPPSLLAEAEPLKRRPGRPPKAAAVRGTPADEDDEDEVLNYDACVLCGFGGYLICCDGCPATFHMKCCGENRFTVPEEGEWLCELCRHRRREGEELRDKASALKCPLRIQGTRFQSRGGRRWDAWSLPGCAVALSAARSGAGSSVSWDWVPQEGGASGKELAQMFLALPHDEASQTFLPLSNEEACSIHSYTNKFKNAWHIVYSELAAREKKAEKKQRKKEGGEKEGRASEGLFSVSKFQWPLAANRTFQVASEVPEGPLEQVLALESGHLQQLVAYVLRVEKEAWGLLQGLWAGPPQLRHQWAQRVRAARHAADLLAAFLELNAQLPDAVRAPSWFLPVEEGATQEKQGPTPVARGTPPTGKGAGKTKQGEAGDTPAPPVPAPKVENTPRSGRRAQALAGVDGSNGAVASSGATGAAPAAETPCAAEKTRPGSADDGAVGAQRGNEVGDASRRASGRGTRRGGEPVEQAPVEAGGASTPGPDVADTDVPQPGVPPGERVEPSVKIKRGPGRPPKKRGRPPKDPNAPPKKRGPGRPPKTARTEAIPPVERRSSRRISDLGMKAVMSPAPASHAEAVGGLEEVNAQGRPAANGDADDDFGWPYVLLRFSAYDAHGRLRQRSAPRQAMPRTRKRMESLLPDWWRGGIYGRSNNFQQLPKEQVRRCARQGGRKRMVSVEYSNSYRYGRRTLATAWASRVEKCQTTAQLAMLLREFDSGLQWELFRTPVKADRKLTEKRVDEKTGEVMYLQVPVDKKRSGGGYKDDEELPEDASAPQSQGANKEGKTKRAWVRESELPLWMLKLYEEGCRTQARKGARQLISKEDLEALVQGTEIEVYWAEDNSWYHGEIVDLQWDADVKVLYSNGDVEALSQADFRGLVDAGGIACKSINKLKRKKAAAEFRGSRSGPAAEPRSKAPELAPGELPPEAKALPADYELLSMIELQLLLTRTTDAPLSRKKMAKWKTAIRIPRDELLAAVAAARAQGPHARVQAMYDAELRWGAEERALRDEKEAADLRKLGVIDFPSNCAPPVWSPFPTRQRIECANLVQSVGQMCDKAGRPMGQAFSKQPAPKLASKSLKRVKRPTDLEGVAASLRLRPAFPVAPPAEGYYFLEEFVADMELIFRNAQDFHGEGSQVFADAHYARKAFRARLQKAFPKCDAGTVAMFVSEPEKARKWKLDRLLALQEKADRAEQAREAAMARALEQADKAEQARDAAMARSLEHGPPKKKQKTDKAAMPPALEKQKQKRAQAAARPAARAEQGLRKSLKVLRKLMKAPEASPFNEPVDTEALPQYRKVIRHPMDLGTICRRLQDSKAPGGRNPHYSSETEVRRDVDLVWKNCRKFNFGGDPIVHHCNALEAQFRQLWDTAFPADEGGGGSLSPLLAKQGGTAKGGASGPGSNASPDGARLGWAVAVQWGDARLSGVVLAFHAPTGQSLVEYDEGTLAWEVLGGKKVVWGGPGVPMRELAPGEAVPPTGEAAVGRRVGVWWESTKSLFYGVVTAFDKGRGRHMVQYDDGDKKLTELHRRRVHWVPPGGATPPPTPAPVPTLAPAGGASGGWGDSIVGYAVRVWWPDDATFYGARVEEFDAERGEHRILYDDDTEEWLDMSRQKLEWPGKTPKKARGRGDPAARPNSDKKPLSRLFDQKPRMRTPRPPQPKQPWGCSKCRYSRKGCKDKSCKGPRLPGQQANGGGAPASSPRPAAAPEGADCVGWRVGVWWEREQATFYGSVTEFDASRGKYRVVYDDGDKRWTNLVKRKVEWVTPASA